MDEKKRYTSKFKLYGGADVHRDLDTSPMDAKFFYLNSNSRPVMCQLWISISASNTELEVPAVESALTRFFHFNKERISGLASRLKNDGDIFCGLLPEDSAELKSHDVNAYFRGIGLLSTCRIYKDNFYVAKRN